MKNKDTIKNKSTIKKEWKSFLGNKLNKFEDAEITPMTAYIIKGNKMYID